MSNLKIFTAFVIGILLAAGFSGLMVYGLGDGSAGPDVYIEPGSGVETASYIIYKDGDYTCVKNGTTGRIDARSSNATLAAQYAMDHLSQNRIYQEKIVFRGNFTFDYHVNVYSYTEIEVQGKIARADNDVSGWMFKSSGTSNISIHGGTLDGNKDNQSQINFLILFTDAQYCTVENVIMENVWGSAVYAYDCNNIRMSHNIVRNVNWSSLVFENYGVDGYNCQIDDNIINDVYIGVHMEAGTGHHISRSQAIGNIINNCSNGVVLTYVWDSKINSNTIISTHEGVGALASRNNTFSSNIISKIGNETLAPGYDNGMRFNDGWAPFPHEGSNNTIVGSKITGFTNGIILYNNTINNLITGNNFVGCTTPVSGGANSSSIISGNLPDSTLENYGATYVPANYYMVQLLHGLDGTPNMVQITPYSNSTNITIWVDHVDSAYIYVRISTTLTTNYNFYWYARV